MDVNWLFIARFGVSRLSGGSELHSTRVALSLLYSSLGTMSLKTFHITPESLIEQTGLGRKQEVVTGFFKKKKREREDGEGDPVIS